MKLNWVFLSILLVFSFSCVSALPILTLKSESFQPYETLIGVVNGTESKLFLDDLKVYQDRRELVVDKEIVNYLDNAYFYIILPQEGDYRLEIRNVRYNETGNLKTMNIIQNLSVKKYFDTNNKSQILSIRPGIINSNSKEVDLYLTNFGEENLSYKVQTNNGTIYPGKTQKVFLRLNKSFEEIVIDSYKKFYLPTFYFGNEEDLNLSVNFSVEKNINLTSLYEKLNLVITKNDSKKNYNFSILNLGEGLNNLTIESDSNLLILNKTNIDYLENKSLAVVYFSLDEKNNESFNSSFKVFYNNSMILFLPIEVYFLEDNGSSVNLNLSSYSGQKDCAALNGTICSSNENCDGDFAALGGLCCFGKCISSETNKSNSNNVIIGVGVLIFISLVVYIFYTKIKKVKKPTAEEKIKQIEEKNK